MDLLAHSLTGVWQVESLASIPYSVYEFLPQGLQDNVGSSRQTDAAIHTTAASTLPDDAIETQKRALLRRLEHHCREMKLLIAVEPDSSYIWFFADGDQIAGVLNNAGSALAGLGPLKLQGLRTTVFRSSKLNQSSTMLRSKAGTPISAPPAPSIFEQSLHASRYANAKAILAKRSLSATAAPAATVSTPSDHHAPALDRFEDPARVHAHFISAVMGLLSYRLSSLHNYIPLNFRTFINPLPSGIEHATRAEEKAVWLTTLDIRLTTSGSLLVVPETSREDGLVSVPASTAPSDVSGIHAGTELWLAPGGRIARYIGTHLPAQGDTAPARSRSPSPVDDTRMGSINSSAEPTVKRWKADVVTWLSQKGICLDAPAAEQRWIWVEILVLDRREKRTGTNKEKHPEMAARAIVPILWPQALCVRRYRAQSNSLDGKLPGRLVQTIPGSGRPLVDPLAFAQSWYGQKEQRDRRTKAKDEARLVEQTTEKAEARTSPGVDQARADDSSGPAPSVIGPENADGLDGASGMHQTPPDGLRGLAGRGPGLVAPPEPAPAHPPAANLPGEQSGADAVAGSRSRSVAHEQSSRWEGPDGKGDASHGRKASAATVFELDAGNFRTGDGGPTFGHLDEDMFNEIGVTEEDFSFFDDPASGTAGNVGLTEAQTKVGAARTEKDAIQGSADIAGPGGDQGAKSDRQDDAHIDPDGSRSPGPERSIETLAKAGEEAGETEGRPGSMSDAGSEPEEMDIVSDEASATASNDRPHMRPKVQVVSPPLDPDVVMKKLLPNELPSQLGTASGSEARETPSREQAGDEPSGFEPVRFNPTLEVATNKYDQQGRFSFPPSDKTVGRLGETRRNAKENVLPRITASNTSSGFFPHRKDRGVLFLPNAPSANNSSQPPQILASYSDHPDVSNKASNDSARRPDLAHSTHQKRKRNSNDDSASVECSLQQLALKPAEPSTLIPLSLDSMDGNPMDWSMAGLFPRIPSGGGVALGLRNGEYVQSAQQIPDQVRLQKVLQRVKGKAHDEDETSLSLTVTSRARHAFEDVLLDIFPRASQCDLSSYRVIEDTHFAGSGHPYAHLSRQHPQLRRTSSTPKPEIASGASRDAPMCLLPPPHVQVRRGEISIQVLPPALEFWETLSFGPCGGPKNVVSFCVFAPLENTAAALDQFLESVASAYESYRFGRHTRGNLFAYYKGLVPVASDEEDPPGTSLQGVMARFRKACCQLGELLINLGTEEQNVVVYIIDPFETVEATTGLCAAFSALLDAYFRLRRISPSRPIHEFVLQIIPLAYVASESSVPILIPEQLFKLSLDLYDRCPLFDPLGWPSSELASSVTLVPAIPARIPFRLSAEPPPTLIQERCCLHIAYSCSGSDQWLSAAWSDTSGALQKSASYCLERLHPPTARRSFAEAAEEIWETSIELVQDDGMVWRFMIVKAGVMGPDEIEGKHGSVRSEVQAAAVDGVLNEMSLLVWTRLASLSARELRISLVLISADPSPPISLVPRTAPSAPASNPPQSGVHGASLAPQADVAAETDGDSTLVDIIDETWAVQLSHGLRNSHSLIERRPALASALLVKRTGPNDEDVPVCMTVSILHAPKYQDSLLRELLIGYRGLGILAKFKGVADARKSVLPWHIATALHAQETLSRYL